MNISEKYYAMGCQQCKSPGSNVPSHRYGDYLILRPSAHTLQRLSQLAKSVIEVITQEISAINLNVNDPEQMHLTLATPLKPLSKTESKQLMEKIANLELPTTINFDLLFHAAKNGGTYAFNFGSKNFAASFHVALKENDIVKNGHQEHQSTTKMKQLANAVQEYCLKNGLVNTLQKADGKCNSFHPHITLGHCKEGDDAIALHNRAAHNKNGEKALSYLCSEIAGKIFTCSSHKYCAVLPLSFDKVELLRVDALKNGTNCTTLLKSYDLNSKTIKTHINSFPTCTHQSTHPLSIAKSPAPNISAQSAEVQLANHSSTNMLDVISNAIKTLTGNSPPYKFSKQVDQRGRRLLCLHFNDQNSANKLFEKVADNKGSIQCSNSDYIVRMGEERMGKLFGDRETGKKILEDAVNSLK